MCGGTLDFLLSRLEPQSKNAICTTGLAGDHDARHGSVRTCIVCDFLQSLIISHNMHVLQVFQIRSMARSQQIAKSSHMEFRTQDPQSFRAGGGHSCHCHIGSARLILVSPMCAFMLYCASHCYQLHTTCKTIFS